MPSWLGLGKCDKAVVSGGVTRQDKTRQDNIRCYTTRQDKIREDKRREDKTRQEKAREDKIIPDLYVVSACSPASAVVFRIKDPDE